MAEKVYVLDGSRKLHIDVILGALLDINSIRNELEIQPVENADAFLDGVVEKLMEPERNQVHYHRLLEEVNKTRLGCTRAGKVIIVDADFYSDSAPNWCFGGFAPTDKGPGYLVVSTARMKDDDIARHVIMHELGHMFGAPSEGRSNTEQMLGLHCINEPCTMQQKLSVADAMEHARQMKARNPYCSQCEADIRGYGVP